jgi:hypothetical protein
LGWESPQKLYPQLLCPKTHHQLGMHEKPDSKIARGQPYGESEASLAAACPEAQESSLWSLKKVFCKSTRVSPVSKSRSIVVRSAPHGNNKSRKDECYHDEDLGKAQPKFGFAEAIHMEDLRGVSLC